MNAEQDAGTVRKRALVHGRVQGVGYRYAAQAEAQSLGLVGTVRNRFDGTVETEAEGSPDAVAAYIDWLHKGPRWADVTGVDVAEAEPKGEAGFSIH